jgi:hypothetical protein
MPPLMPIVKLKIFPEFGLSMRVVNNFIEDLSGMFAYEIENWGKEVIGVEIIRNSKVV